jgi:hypothetical protein
MAGDEYALRKRLTFEQAEGVEALPSQLALKKVSKELRALLWSVVHSSIMQSFAPARMHGDRPQLYHPWDQIFADMHVYRDAGMIDEFSNSPKALIAKAKSIFETGNYTAVFGWLQWVLRHPNVPSGFAQSIGTALRAGRAAYQIVDDDTIVPVGSDAENANLERAFADLATGEFPGARGHLRSAAEELTAGHYANSIRESIHAVESVARTLEPTAELSKALTRLETSAKIHGGLKRGFNAIYGYTSDEKGIRHPMLEQGSPAVDEADALFMIGACASFVSYLINKARASGLIKS